MPGVQRTAALAGKGIAALALWAIFVFAHAWAKPEAGIRLEQLPPEAKLVLERIKAGGPFPYRQDGVVFGNRERLLPERKRGYYREYTVPTPGARDRGARRIVSGAADEFWYTEDHYKSFRRIRE